MSVLSRAGTGAGVMDGSRGAVAPPRPAILWAIALAGVAAAACTVVLRLTSDHGGAEPGLQAALLDWIVCSYILSGLIAWWRRPGEPPRAADGRRRVLDRALEPLVGERAAGVHDRPGRRPGPVRRLPARLPRLPDGACSTAGWSGLWSSRAYLVAVGLQLLGLMLGGFDPENVLAIVSEPDARRHPGPDPAHRPRGALRSAASACSSAAGGPGARPLRRSAALLVDSFSLALVMIAVLLITGAFFPQEFFFLPIQRATFVVIGLAPIAFLVALLDARLARSSVGELMIELHARADAARPQRAARPRAARSLAEARLLAAPVRDLDRLRRAGRCGFPATTTSGPTTLIEREGEPVAALMHDRGAQATSRSCSTRSAPRRRSRSRTGSCTPSSSARLEELRGLARAGDRGRSAGARAARAQPPRRRPAAADRPLARARAARDAASATTPRPGVAIDEARQEIAVSLDELRDVARGLHPAVLSAHGLPVAVESLAATSAVPVRLTIELDSRVDEQAEVAAYYVVSESLANVGKHARAASATVDIVRRQRRPRGRDRRRRRRRRRHGVGLGPSRPRRPGRGARRPAAGLDPARRRDAGAGGDAMRVAIAEDSVLLREGLVRLLDDAGFDVVAQCGTADELLLKVNSYPLDVAVVDIRLPPTHRDEGLRAALADPRRPSRGRGARALAVRRAGAGDEAARRLGRGRRIPAQGPDRRRRRVHRRGAPGRGRRLGARSDHRLDPGLAGGAATTRSPSSPRASARCSS